MSESGWITTSTPTLSWSLFSLKNDEILKALARFHEEMGPIKKEGTNPHFRSSYTLLPDVIDAIEGPLKKAGLILTQHSVFIDDAWVLVTRLTHVESGEWTQNYTPILTDKPGPQAFGSGQSYARRYSLCSLLMLKEVDDDGEGASARGGGKSAYGANPKPSQSTNPTEAQIKRLYAIMKKTNWQKEDVLDYLGKMGLTSTKELNYVQYETLCKNMENFPKSPLQ